MAEVHRSILGDVAAMNAVQLGGSAAVATLPPTPAVAAWNVERCLFPEDTAAHLQGNVAPDVVLLSEVDHGMARTGQRHTTEAVAAALGMAYAFGVEFHELGLGGPTELHFCTDDTNALGWHGNAILSSAPFTRAAMVGWMITATGTAPAKGPPGTRTSRVLAGAWRFWPRFRRARPARGCLHPSGKQRRRGASGPAVSSSAGGGGRLRPGASGAHRRRPEHREPPPPDFDWRQERLFAVGEAEGYDWSFTADGPTTRPSLITPHPTRVMKLDCWRGGACAVLPRGSKAPSGRRHAPVGSRSGLVPGGDGLGPGSPRPVHAPANSSGCAPAIRAVCARFCAAC